MEGKMWYDKQKWKLHEYRRLAKLPDDEYRKLLFQVTGYSTSKDGRLTQADYDYFMAALEAALEYRVAEGFCPPPPDKIEMHYWRKRLAENKEAGKRLLHKVYELWAELKTALPAEKQNIGYLHGIAAQACRMRRVESLTVLKGWALHILIEALKAHIFQERKRTAQERVGLPGMDPAPDYCADVEEVGEAEEAEAMAIAGGDEDDLSDVPF
jgi:hypothetical protein